MTSGDSGNVRGAWKQQKIMKEGEKIRRRGDLGSKVGEYAFPWALKSRRTELKKKRERTCEKGHPVHTHRRGEEVKREKEGKKQEKGGGFTLPFLRKERTEKTSTRGKRTNTKKKRIEFSAAKWIRRRGVEGTSRVRHWGERESVLRTEKQKDGGKPGAQDASHQRRQKRVETGFSKKSEERRAFRKKNEQGGQRLSGTLRGIKTPGEKWVGRQITPQRKEWDALASLGDAGEGTVRLYEKG